MGFNSCAAVFAPCSSFIRAEKQHAASFVLLVLTLPSGGSASRRPQEKTVLVLNGDYVKGD